MRRRQKKVEPLLLDLRPLRDELLDLPCEPVSRSHPRHWAFKFKRTLDFVGHARPAPAGFFRQLNPYPKPFRHVLFETEDGVTIAAWYGPPHDAEPEAAGVTGDGKASGGGGKVEPDAPAATAGPQPHDPPFGLVLVPGMFSTKDDSVHKRRAIWLWRHWKVPVLCIDMRAFGESNGIATGGWKESFDVHGAARFLKEKAGVQRVGVIGESMGGASVLNALAYDEESEARIINGGTMLFSAFVDLRDAVHYISSEPPREDPFHAQWAGFRRLLKYKSHGGYERFDEYLDDAARVNGLAGFEEMADLANPKWKTSLIKTPVLLVHAADDPVVPIRHARRMERYAKDYPHIQVMTTSWGRHTGFESMEPWWFWEVMRRFFSSVNDIDLPNPIQRR